MSHINPPVTCAHFEATVSDYVDGALSPGERAALDAHVAQCAECASVQAEVTAIVLAASHLPLLSPSHDLWEGISSRLDTPVLSIGQTGSPLGWSQRPPSFRMLAAAAVLIVAVSSGVTYQLTRANPAVQNVPEVSSSSSGATLPAPTVAPQVAALDPEARSTVPQTVSAPATAPSAPVGDRTRSRYASNDGSADVVYEREIAAMRRIVDERLGDLDSATVVEIERNLHIIDKAISDSRRALERDPRSRFLSSQLDRALETKLGVLRRIALL